MKKFGITEKIQVYKVILATSIVYILSSESINAIICSYVPLPVGRCWRIASITIPLLAQFLSFIIGRKPVILQIDFLYHVCPVILRVAGRLPLPLL